MAAFVAKQMMGSKLNAVKGQMNAVGGGGQSEGEQGEEEADPERLEAVREAEEQRRLKHQKMEEEREKLRQGIRDKYGLQKKEDEEEENPLTDDNRPAEIEVDDFTRWKNTLEAHLGGIRQTIESKCVLQ